MRSFLAGIWIAVAASAWSSLPTAAMMNQLIVNDSPAAAVVAYTGPGDVVSGAGGFWGTFAYSSATRGSDAVDIQRNSDSTTCTHVKTLATTGLLDVSAGTPCAGSTVTSFCNATTCTITKLYDQSGNAAHATQATVANQATLVFNCASLTGATCATGNSNCSTNVGQTLYNATIASLGRPNSWSTVAERTGCTTTLSRLETSGSGNTAMSFGFHSTANNAWMFMGSLPVVSATDNVLHALQFVFNNVSSVIYVDGTNNAVNAGGNTGSFGGPIELIGSVAVTGQGLKGNWFSMGVWSNGFTTGVSCASQAACLSAMNSAEHTILGF